MQYTHLAFVTLAIALAVAASPVAVQERVSGAAAVYAGPGY